MMGSEQIEFWPAAGIFCNPAVNDHKTILFVDDDLVILEMRRLIFESLGYTVLTARTEEAALTLMRQHPIDAVVIDHLLPGTNGVETASRIRRSDSGVTIISSSGGSRLPEGLRKFIDAAVPKSEGPEALIEILYRQLWESNRYPA
jgi:CheY-like chemotaxis protein